MIIHSIGKNKQYNYKTMKTSKEQYNGTYTSILEINDLIRFIIFLNKNCRSKNYGTVYPFSFYRCFYVKRVARKCSMSYLRCSKVQAGKGMEDRANFIFPQK